MSKIRRIQNFQHSFSFSSQQEQFGPFFDRFLESDLGKVALMFPEHYAEPYALPHKLEVALGMYRLAAPVAQKGMQGKEGRHAAQQVPEMEKEIYFLQLDEKETFARDFPAGNPAEFTPQPIIARALWAI
ncbi:MAG TPA: hypothetical protein VFM69_09180 [Pricia sp.]|nr:hypothetical protein [Pricia sp.]